MNVEPTHKSASMQRVPDMLGNSDIESFCGQLFISNELYGYVKQCALNLPVQTWPSVLHDKKPVARMCGNDKKRVLLFTRPVEARLQGLDIRCSASRGDFAVDFETAIRPFAVSVLDEHLIQVGSNGSYKAHPRTQDVALFDLRKPDVPVAVGSDRRLEHCTGMHGSLVSSHEGVYELLWTDSVLQVHERFTKTGLFDIASSGIDTQPGVVGVSWDNKELMCLSTTTQAVMALPYRPFALTWHVPSRVMFVLTSGDVLAAYNL